MATHVDLQLDGNLDDLLLDQDYEDLVQDVVNGMATAASAAAPRDDGDGAESIHGEVHRGAPSSAFASTYQPESDQPIGYVSWDQDHFYMGFKEVGTEREPAQPFLRPSLDRGRV